MSQRRRGSYWDLFWKDDGGRVVIWQFPNGFLIGWAVLTVLSLIFNGHVADVLSWLASVSLIIWSVLEITKGADYFRRILGLVVFIAAIMSLLKNL